MIPWNLIACDLYSHYECFHVSGHGVCSWLCASSSWSIYEGHQAKRWEGSLWVENWDATFWIKNCLCHRWVPSLWTFSSGIRVISNAGGINPHACAVALQAAAQKADVDFKIAVVTGDDLMPVVWPPMLHYLSCCLVMIPCISNYYLDVCCRWKKWNLQVWLTWIPKCHSLRKWPVWLPTWGQSL